MKKNNLYTFTGKNIFSFYSLSEIVDYMSHVRNNEVPYPYAIDRNENIYFLIEGVVMKNRSLNYDPYKYYYKHYLITQDLGTLKLPKRDYRIKEFYIGDEQFTLTYTPIPNKSFDKFNDKIYFVYTNNLNKIELNKEKYIELMEEIGRQNDFYHILFA